MSTSLKYALPLASKELSINDINEDSGFINAFTFNINAPCMQNHIFLMYDWQTNSHKKFLRHKKMINDPALHGYCYYTINGKKYLVYTYPIFGETIKNLKANILRITSTNDIIAIIKFWNGEDDEINKWSINRSKYVHVDWEESILPEKDECTNKKSGKYV